MKVKAQKIQKEAANGQEKEETKPQAERLEESKVIIPSDLKNRLVERVEETLEQRIASTRELLKHPVPAGHRLFETYDGEVIMGEDDQDQIWCERLNHGKGAWVLPVR